MEEKKGEKGNLWYKIDTDGHDKYNMVRKRMFLWDSETEKDDDTKTKNHLDCNWDELVQLILFVLLYL